MDPDSYASKIISALSFGLPWPGNSNGATTISSVAGDLAEKVGGQSNGSFTEYANSAAGAVKSAVTLPYRVVHGAYTEVKDAAHRAADFTEKAQDAAVNAARGFAAWTKWIVIGVVALAILYFLAIVGPLARRP